MLVDANMLGTVCVSGSLGVHHLMMPISDEIWTPVTQKPAGVRSSAPSFTHATFKHRGQVLVQPCAESRLERTRQVDPGAADITERVDEQHSN